MVMTAQCLIVNCNRKAPDDEAFCAKHRDDKGSIAANLEAAQTVIADAARYRWLRDHSCPPHNFYISVPDEFHGVRYAPEDVDAYIDAALAKQEANHTDRR